MKDLPAVCAAGTQTVIRNLQNGICYGEKQKRNQKRSKEGDEGQDEDQA